MYSTLAPFLMIFTELILAQDNKQNEDLSSSEEDFLNTPKFSLRSSDFAEIATTASFVDKSMFIKTFVEDKEVVVITAPNHFGKSTNVNMLKRFVTIAVVDYYKFYDSSGKNSPFIFIVNDPWQFYSCV